MYWILIRSSNEDEYRWFSGIDIMIELPFFQVTARLLEEPLQLDVWLPEAQDGG
jgi:hypothetical protein